MANLGIYELADHHCPIRIQQHRLEFLGTEALEQCAANLVGNDFTQRSSLRFLRQVCRWGGYYGIAARIQQNNQTGAICQAFIGAWEQLLQENVLDALVAINALHGLGQPSFASKFLRFLAPMQAPILDRIISARTGFPLNADGYGQLIEACRDAAAHLAAAGIVNPVRPDGVWYVADIEAAFYADMENLEA